MPNLFGEHLALARVHEIIICLLILFDLKKRRVDVNHVTMLIHQFIAKRELNYRLI
jgi:hypothetical protein